MDLAKLGHVQENVIRRMYEYTKDNLIASVIEEASDDLPESISILMDGLGLDGDEAIGELMFLPLTEDDAFHTMLVSVILSDDIKEDYLDELLSAVTYLNFYLPVGAFSYSPFEKMLVYKNSGLLDLEMSEDEVYNQAQIYISNAFLLVDRYIEILLKIAEGKSNTEELLELLGF